MRAEPLAVKAKPQRSRWFLVLSGLGLLVLLWLVVRYVPFDAASLRHELRAVSFQHIVLATLTIYACYWLRAARWAVLLGGVQRVSAIKLLPSQLMGFTAVALFGRVADLGRPYLVARRLGTAVATQIGVYGVERTLDLGAAAAVFSGTLALAPQGLPHREAFARAGLLAFAGTLCLAALLVTVSAGGERLAEKIAGLLRPLSVRVADATQLRLREFRGGFGAGSSSASLLWAATLSVLMWLGIALTYLLTARAFKASPPLAALSFAGTVLLMATGIGGSVLQLPLIGWFTQIAVLAGALHALFGVPAATATACGTLLLAVANLSVVPAGLLAARVTHTSLREATKQRAEDAGEPGVAAT